MGIRENFFHRNKQKNWVNIGDGLVLWLMGSQRVGPDWATELNWTESMNYQKNAVNQSMLISHLLFIKQIWCFYWPSRGRTKQLKADTVALAKTWQGAPHTAAEMFPGENPAPNTCMSLPPRRPLKTKMRSLPSQRQIFFFFFFSKFKPMLSCCPPFFPCLMESTQLAWDPWFFQFPLTKIWALKPILSNPNHTQQPMKSVMILTYENNTCL